MDADAGDQHSADPSGSGPEKTKRKKIDEKNPPNNKDPEILEKIQQIVSSTCVNVNDEDLRKLIKEQHINKEHLFQFLCSLHELCVSTTQDSPQDSSQTTGSSSGSRLSSQPPPPVKVHPVVTGRTFGADDVILQRVSQSTNVEKTNEQDCDFIIVFCPIKSRVGSDVEAAMRNTPGGKPVILVLMHHTRDVDFSVDIKRWSDTYDNIKLDVHVLYHETQRGLLTCPRNDGAIQQIQKLLDTRNETVCVTQV